MSGSERAAVEVLADAAIQMPWPEHEVEAWLVSWARQAVGGYVAVEVVPAPPPDVSLLFGDRRYLVARRRLGDPPLAEPDRRLLAALAAMATASRHAAQRDASLRRRALTDDLTGLWHHQYFREVFEGVAETRLGETIGVLFLDLDGMKLLNEALGHLDADEVLRDLGERLRGDLFPEDSFAARTGGDEFAVVVRHLDDAHHLDRLVADLHEALRAPIAVGDRIVSVEVSIGAVLSRDGADDPEALLREAERRMRIAKRSRRPDALPPRWYDDRTVLRDMIDQGRIEVAYQPVVDIGNGGIIGYEALVRGRSLDLGPVSPMMLVGAAAKLSMLDELTEVVVAHSLSTMREVVALAGRPVSLSVNLEFEQLRDDSRLLRSLPARFDGSDVHLILEISERNVARWTPPQRALAVELDDAGIGLAVDDFGTGYSSLNLLTSWAWEWVKIDRALVAEQGGEPSRTLLGHVVRMLGDLDLTPVVEGIETPDELAHARAIGIGLAQGTLCAAPASAEAVLAAVRRQGLRLDLPDLPDLR